MKTLLRCDKFDVVQRDVRGRDGRTHPRQVVVHPGAVVVLPLIEPDRVVMIHQWRHTIERELLELPAGTLDRPGEDPAAAARRELEEETGYRAGRLEPLCEFYPSPGMLTELIRAYVARDLSPARQALDATERIRVEILPLSEAFARVARGEIIDAKTLIALLRWRLRGECRP